MFDMARVDGPWNEEQLRSTRIGLLLCELRRDSGCFYHAGRCRDHMVTVLSDFFT